MDSIQEKLDMLLTMRKDIVDLIEKDIDNIKDKVDLEKSNYATSFDFLGLFCPSLVVDLITGGYKKGRIQKNQPKSKKYTKCYYDQDGNILYFERYNQFGCDCTYYFLRNGNKLYAAPFISDTKQPYPAYVYFAVFDDREKIIEYSELTTSSITYERYEYTNDKEAVCYRYYYVPKGINTPLQEAKIYLSLNNQKVEKLDYYKLENGDEKLTYFYAK